MQKNEKDPCCANSTGPKSNNQPDQNTEHNTSANTDFQANQDDNKSIFKRPGVLDKTLLRAGVRRVTAEEAMHLCKCNDSGTWIPYFTLRGQPVLDGGEPYGRLRKDTDGTHKYHQEGKTSSYIYISPGFALRFNNGRLEFLIVVEGEFKALSLFEDGYSAIAFPGFYGYSSDRATNMKALLPDLKELLDIYMPKKVFFLGDADTSVNIDFSIAALNLARLIAPIPLYLPRLPISGEKGIDDVKEALS